jgi:UDP-4-amino-4,6-dideoxy-N-acetyl-beta-L-altrosamine transaminase
MNAITLPYGRHCIDEDDIAAVSQVLASDWLTTGPAVERFEETLKAAVNAPHVVAVANGTAALHLAYLALGIGPGDSVIVPAITFVATANAARQTGADVVFADVDAATGLITPETLKAAFEKAQTPVKAVAVVHLGGQPVALEDIAALCKANGAYLVEDACHAIGSTYKASTIGDCTYSDVATFSFHPVKTIAMGEGGAVTTRDDAIASKVKTLRHHALEAPMDGPDAAAPWVRHQNTLGYNYRACDIQCALGASQLQKLPQFKSIRAALYAQYSATLDALNVPVALNPLETPCDPCWHLAAVKIDFAALGITRQWLVEFLKARAIGTQVHYYPINAQPYYTQLYGPPDTPGAQAYYDQTLSLPLHVGMSLAEVNMVCRALGDALTQQSETACA